jgi:hypothetical protein
VSAPGYIRCSFVCAEEDAQYALDALAKHGRVVEQARQCEGGVTWQIDLASVPAGDGRLVEEVIRRDVQRAVSTHAKVTP